MQFDYPHTLSTEAARERLVILSEYLNNRHGISVKWEGEKGRFSGRYLMISIEGELSVDADRVHFDGKDPGLLWRKKATKYLREKLAFYLDPSADPATLPRNK